MAKTKRVRKKKSYLKGLAQEPVLVGKWPSKDRAHAVPYAKPYFVAGIFTLISVASIALVAVGAIYFYQNQTLDGFKVLGATVGVYAFLYCLAIACLCVYISTFTNGCAIFC